MIRLQEFALEQTKPNFDLIPFLGAFPIYLGEWVARSDGGGRQKMEKGALPMSRHIMWENRCAESAWQRGKLSGKWSFL